MWTDIFSAGSVALYATTLIIVVRKLFQKPEQDPKLIFGLAGAAIMLHGMALSDSLLGSGGQNMSMLVVASLVSWLISAMMTLAIPRFAVLTLLPVIYGFSLLSVLGVWLVPTSYITHFELHPERLIHICLALSAYSTLVIAAFYAVQLLMIDSRLKNKQLNLTQSALPPLMLVEKQLFQLILAGVLLLTLSLASGFFFLQEAMFAQGKAHKAILSIFAWGLYVYLLMQHHKAGVKIRTSVTFTLGGALLLTLAYFGSRFVNEVLMFD